MSVAEGTGERSTALPELVLDRAVDALLSLQNSDGHWVGELEGDTILQSEYMMTHWFLGWQERDREELSRCLSFMRRQQNDDGGYSIYPGGPADVSASVKAYFVFKLSGEDPESPAMRRLREKILALGGLHACNTFTKIQMAMFGQYPWRDCPAVPPELVLFPRWFPFNIYEMSSWSRTIVIPLSLIWATRPVCEVPVRAHLGELLVSLSDAPEYQPLRVEGASRTWQLVFHSIDKAAKLAESVTGKLKRRPLRHLAIRKAIEWMRARFENSDGLGGIFPPIANSLMAFHALGIPDDDPDYRLAEKALKGLRVCSEEAEEIRIQPCHSPVWDTALAANALALAAGDKVNKPLERAFHWLLDREVKNHGDWAEKVRGVEPAGWYFEYQNEYYPDIDDTIMVMMALERTSMKEAQEPIRRAMSWVRAMQSRDGGWAAFDRDNNRWIMTNVPFADHNAMLDPPTADITARTLEMMGIFGIGNDDPQVVRALDFIRKNQEPEGCWYGRWGVNYIYGTWQVLRGLYEIGEDMTQGYVRRAADWLESVQNADGGFGESIASYDDRSLMGCGPSTPSQTAWAMMGLVAAGRFRGTSARRAVEYLVTTQRADGTWEEEHWTGTGFPKVFYLRYYLYGLYFPIMSLAMWRDAMKSPARRSAESSRGAGVQLQLET
ncbi:MAG: squalene--hopene cyclase [Planctomycetes bacterium]|nr:squalene--hopene cyclase [Planctomycetota bacterium]